MDFEVALNRLKFGQEDGAGINARITGRDDGIAELAANIHARGQIENLVVKDAGDGFYAVSNGNRRLAAFHMIYGSDSGEPIRCTLRDVDEAGAFEDSLTTAVTAKQLHPVDQYEAFARLRDRHDKSIEEIANQYGMTEREVEQALALGHLSPRVRDLWRKGEIKASAAKAFTLAPDHKSQDEIIDQYLDSGYKQGVAKLVDMDDSDVKRSLKIGNDKSGVLVEFIGIEAYEARGGKVTRDLFGTDHKVSDAKLAKTMAAECLADECKRLKDAGWSFAVSKESVRNHYDYSALKVEDAPTEEERQKLDQLVAMFDPSGNFGETYDGGLTYFELTGPLQLAYRTHREMQNAIALRPYTAKMMEKAGCFVGLDEYGMLEIEYGRVKPAQKEKAAEVVKAEKKEQTKAAAKTAKAGGKPAPESQTTLSNALKDRLEMMLVSATRDAIIGEPLLVNSPLFEILARVTCSQIATERAWGTPDAIRTKLPSIRQVLNKAVFNAALAKRFDAEDYLSNAPKGFVIKAIAEAINPDEARKISGKTKAEIWKFALANIGKTGWLPKELRTVHYAGPGSEGYKRPAAVVAPEPDAKPSTSEAIAKAKQERAVKANENKMKRAAKTKSPKRKERPDRGITGRGGNNGRGITRGRGGVSAAHARP